MYLNPTHRVANKLVSLSLSSLRTTVASYIGRNSSDLDTKHLECDQRVTERREMLDRCSIVKHTVGKCAVTLALHRHVLYNSVHIINNYNVQ